jgi:hypothetical protein
VIALLLGVALAAPVQVTPKLLLLPSSPGDAPAALRALSSGRTVLVVVERDGTLVRFEGTGDAWRRVATLAAKPAAEDVAIDASGVVWVRRGDDLRRWDGDALVAVPLPPSRRVGLRASDHAALDAGEGPTSALAIAPGLVVDVVAPEPPAGSTPTPRLHADGDGWALEVGGTDQGPPLLATAEAVDAIDVGDGWVELIGSRLRWLGRSASHTGELADLALGDLTDVAVRSTGGTSVAAIAWDARTLRAVFVDPADTAPLRWVESWMPAGPPLTWPRPTGPRDPLQVTRAIEVTLPADIEIFDVAVSGRSLIVAGEASTVDGQVPSITIIPLGP